MKESACRTKTKRFELTIESIPFHSLPGQSRLFLDHLERSPSIKPFYPNRSSNFDEAAKFSETVLRTYPAHRSSVCDALAAMNRRFNAGEMALANIERLREDRTVAVLTGQQAGIFGGPLYTVYKALSAIKLAEQLTQNGVSAVPIFWVATEDHDFDEIAQIDGIGNGAELISTRISRDPSEVGKPVGNITVEAGIRKVIDQHLAELGETEHSVQLRELLNSSWVADDSLGVSFCRFIARLFEGYGLIVADPMDGELRRLSSPLIRSSILKANEINAALLGRTSELKSAGYHEQVKIEADHFPLFLFNEFGKRTSIKLVGEGKFVLTGSREELSVDELLQILSNATGDLSPSVMLRPVVQDYLFPTICYLGGAAEIAYFGQNSVVYELLDRPVTPIEHRQSITFVEPKHRRTLEKFDLGLVKMFDGFEAVSAATIDRFIRPENASTFTEAESKIGKELDKLDLVIGQIDPTLSASVAMRRRKIEYHISALQKKYHKVLSQTDEEISRRLGAAFSELLPHSGLQERTIGITTYLNRHGFEFVDWLYESIDVSDRCHLTVSI